MSPEILTALILGASALMTAAVAAYGSFRANAATAKKSELGLMQEQIDYASDRQDYSDKRQFWLEQCGLVQYKNITILLRYISELQRILRSSNIDVPTEPVLEQLPPPPIPVPAVGPRNPNKQD